VPQPYDIVILGATAAGYAAAYYLARRKCSVAVLRAPQPASECPLTDWAPAGSLKLPGLPRGLAADCGASGFEAVRYHNAGLDQTVRSSLPGPAGVLVDYRALSGALRAAASEAGVRTRSSTTPPAVQLEEDVVRLVGSGQLTGRIVLVVGGDGGRLLAELIPSSPRRAETQLAAAGLDVPLTAAQAATFDRDMHVLEMPHRGDLGILFAHGRTLHVRVVAGSPAAAARADELSEMLGRLQEADLVPGDLQLGRARGAVWHPPAAALQLESHVAKRCLLAGTAGGFAGPVTGQTIKPSIASALLAAATALDALKSGNVHARLARFKSAWREQLGQHLRPPATSLHLLLPLVFANQNIVNRFTRALLYGQDI